MVLQRNRYGESDGFAMDMTSRKQLRLPEYDYSTPGAYFVTICTHDRQCILSDIIVGADAYPKGTGSGSRSFLAGRHWRSAARNRG